MTSTVGHTQCKKFLFFFLFQQTDICTYQTHRSLWEEQGYKTMSEKDNTLYWFDCMWAYKKSVMQRTSGPRAASQPCKSRHSPKSCYTESTQVPSMTGCSWVSLCFPWVFDYVKVFKVSSQIKDSYGWECLLYLVLKLAALLSGTEGWKLARLRCPVSPWTWLIRLQELIPCSAITGLFLHGHLG